MRKILSSLIILLVLFCGKRDYLDVKNITISGGGYATTKITAYINVEVGSVTRQIFVEWCWRSEDGMTTEKNFECDLITVSESRIYESSIETEEGYVWVGYFWVEVYDEEHNLLAISEEVHCYQ